MKIEEGIISARDSQHTIKSVTDIKAILPTAPEDGSPDEVFHHNHHFVKSSSEVLYVYISINRVIYYRNVVYMEIQNC